jgi:hypothetical protein
VTDRLEARDEDVQSATDSARPAADTVGTGSALAIGCVLLALALLAIAIVARVVFGLW